MPVNLGPRTMLPPGSSHCWCLPGKIQVNWPSLYPEHVGFLKSSPGGSLCRQGSFTLLRIVKSSFKMVAFRSLFISVAAVHSLDFSSTRLIKGNKISERVKVALEIAAREAWINTRKSADETMHTILLPFCFSPSTMKSSPNLDTAFSIPFQSDTSCGNRSCFC